MEMKPISVSKEELNEDLFEDVLFFKFAEGGAMGEPGGVVWVKANGESYHCNYCYGDVRYEDLLKLFAPLKKCSFGMFGLGSTVPGEWKYVSLGMGNHLIVAAPAYDEFKELTKDVQRVSELYGRWYETALKITKNEKEKAKMKNGITELVFIIDRSGSMAGLESDTIGGFNAMIEEQKKLDGKVYVSTVLFANCSQVIHDRKDLSEIQPMTDKQYRVGGGTALLDAIGGAIHHIGNVHKYARPEDVPEKTMFIITTDGMENASCQYGSDKVKKMIRRQEERYGWEFLFVAANIDAVETAERIGIRRERAANYRHDAEGTEMLYCAMSATVANYRANAEVADNWADALDEEKK